MSCILRTTYQDCELHGRTEGKNKIYLAANLATSMLLCTNESLKVVHQAFSCLLEQNQLHVYWRKMTGFRVSAHKGENGEHPQKIKV